MIAVLTCCQGLMLFHRGVIAPGVAAGGFPGTMQYLPLAAALAVQPGAYQAEAQALAIAQGELLTADRSSSADIQWLQKLACWAPEPKRSLQQVRSSACAGLNMQLKAIRNAAVSWRCSRRHMIAVLTCCQSLMMFHHGVIASGVAAGEYPGTMEYLPPATTLEMPYAAAYYAQGLAVAQGELLQADQ